MTNNGTPPDFGLQPLPEDYRIANRPSRIAQGHTVAEWFEEGAKMATTKPTHRAEIEARVAGSKDLYDCYPIAFHAESIELAEAELRGYDFCLEDMADVFAAFKALVKFGKTNPYQGLGDAKDYPGDVFRKARAVLARHA